MQLAQGVCDVAFQTFEQQKTQMHWETVLRKVQEVGELAITAACHKLLAECVKKTSSSQPPQASSLESAATMLRVAGEEGRNVVEEGEAAGLTTGSLSADVGELCTAFLTISPMTCVNHDPLI